MPIWKAANRLKNSAYGTHYEDTPRKGAEPEYVVHTLNAEPAKAAPIPKRRPYPNVRHNMHQHPGKSGYYGVTAWKNGWKARICVDRQQMHLGVFPTAIEAARRYNEIARRYLGARAVLNELPEGDTEHG